MPKKKMNNAYTDFIEQRNKEIVEFTKKGYSAAYIAIKFGITKDMVKKIQRILDIKPEVETLKQNDNDDKKKVLSEYHKALGLKMSIFMLESEIRAQEMAALLGMSFKRLSSITKGQVDPTLSEIIKILDLLKVTLEELIGDAKNNGELSTETVPDSTSGVSPES